MFPVGFTSRHDEFEMAQIVYAAEKYFESFHQALDQVAREKIYIEMIEAKPLAKVIDI